MARSIEVTVEVSLLDDVTNEEQLREIVQAIIDGRTHDKIEMVELVQFTPDQEDPAAEDECPVCQNGTIAAEGGFLVCRGECGEVWPAK